MKEHARALDSANGQQVVLLRQGVLKGEVHEEQGKGLSGSSTSNNILPRKSRRTQLALARCP